MCRTGPSQRRCRTSIPRFLRLRCRSPAITLAAEMRAIVLAGLEYAIEHSEWPKTLDDLKINNKGAGHVDLGRYAYYPLNQESLEGIRKRWPSWRRRSRPLAAADSSVCRRLHRVLRDPERLKRLFPSESKSPPASNEKKKEGLEAADKFLHSMPPACPVTSEAHLTKAVNPGDFRAAAVPIPLRSRRSTHAAIAVTIDSLLDRGHPCAAGHVADPRQGARRNVGLD